MITGWLSAFSVDGERAAGMPTPIDQPAYPSLKASNDHLLPLVIARMFCYTGRTLPQIL